MCGVSLARTAARGVPGGRGHVFTAGLRAAVDGTGGAREALRWGSTAAHARRCAGGRPELESVHRSLDRPASGARASDRLRVLKEMTSLRDLPRPHSQALSRSGRRTGACIQQPLDLEVGAGTSHPETLLRVLGAEAVERRVRAAVAPSRRWALRPESEPAVQAPPVPGDPQAVAGRGPAALSRQPRSRAASIRGSTTSGSRKTTGSRRRSARGASAGR